MKILILLACLLPLPSIADDLGPQGFEESILRAQADDMGERDITAEEELNRSFEESIVRSQAADMGKKARYRRPATQPQMKCKSHNVKGCHACTSTQMGFEKCMSKKN